MKRTVHGFAIERFPSANPMKPTSILLLSLMSALPLQAQETYLNTDFEKGIPADYTLLDLDELPVGSGFSVPVESHWFALEVYGASGNSAVSTSRHPYDLPADNWLISPAFTVLSADAVFAWDAKSVHYDLRDGYQVLVSTTDKQPESFKPLYSVDSESYTWRHHILSLAEYAGKTIHIAIRHNSQRKFLLAVDNLYAGVPAELSFEMKNNTRHFCGNTGTTEVAGSLRNTGRPVRVKAITCTSGLNVLTCTMNDKEVRTGEALDFHFDLPVTLNTLVPYQISIVTTDGTTYPLNEKHIACSYFPRTLLAEKATALWCTACPGLMGFMNELKEEYKDEIVLIESHAAFGDNAHLSYGPYDTGMQTSNYPTLYFNRAQNYPSYSMQEAKGRLKLAVQEQTPALIRATTQLQDGKITVKAEMQFGLSMNNEKDQYRIGFALLEKHRQLPYPQQKSSIRGAVYEEFGLLSSPIDKDLFFLHNTVIGTSSAFTGVPKSLPAALNPGQSYLYEGTIELPDGKTTVEGITLVAFVLDYFNNRVLNTTEIPIEGETSGIIAEATAPSPILIRPEKGGLCRITLPENAPYQLTVTDCSGRVLQQLHGTGRQQLLPTRNWGRGNCLVTVRQAQYCKTQKLFIE